MIRFALNNVFRERRIINHRNAQFGFALHRSTLFSHSAKVKPKMDSNLSFPFRDRNVPVSFLPSISPDVAQQALESEIFRIWYKRCEKENGGRKIALHSVELQHVDMFGPRVGFVKMKATSTLVDGSTHHKHQLPGICFLRGGAVAILVALICEEEDGKVYSLLVDQPR